MLNEDDASKVLDGYADLKEGWDGYRARPIDKTAIANAKNAIPMVLFSLKEMVVIVIDPAPLADGGVDVTFMNGERELTLSFPSDSNPEEPIFDGFYGDSSGSQSFKGTLRKHKELLPWLRALADLPNDPS